METMLNKWKRYLAEQTQPAADDGKAELIQTMIDKLTSMKTDTNFTAAAVAQSVYNNAAHWMNKTDIFSNRPGEPMQTKASFAPKQ